MNRNLLRRLTGTSVLLASMLCSSLLYGQAKITIDPDRWVTIGGGLRSAFRTTETGPATGTWVQKIALDNVRLYFNGQLHKDFQVEVNTDLGSANELQLLDAVVKYAPSPYFNIWMGRHLPPSDRSNLDGPFYLSAYDYPGIIYQYPVNFIGARDNGVSFSGQVEGGKFKYAFGAYDGAPTVLGTKDNMLYAMRLTANLWDPEPGYYNSSTYYGEKNILAIGFVLQHQGDIVISNGTAAGFTGWNVDLLAEKKLPSDGVLTLEGAFYNYDFEANPSDGSAFLAQAAYLFPKTAGIGKFQPLIRYQDYLNTSQFDVGTNYVIKGHSARLSAFYTYFDNGAASSSRTSQFKIGTQFQF